MERQEVSILRTDRNGILLYCEKCGAKVVMLPVDTATAVTGTTPRTLYRWIDEDKLHFVESSDGTVLLCAESLKTLA